LEEENFTDLRWWLNGSVIYTRWREVGPEGRGEDAATANIQYPTLNIQSSSTETEETETARAGGDLGETGAPSPGR
jgi:hypothetical protein